MVKIGDTVRYLNAVGGGVVTRIDGQIAYVDDGGFETPVLVSELVAIMPAGHVKDPGGPKLLFDQKAFDAARSDRKVAQPAAGNEKKPSQVPPAEETPYGDKMSLVLAFEPSDTRNLSAASFNAVLVNDSNYCLEFVFASRGSDDRGWNKVYEGRVEPNELIDLVQLSHEDLPAFERMALQAVAFKQGKTFELKTPVNVIVRPDLTKFHKLHCFRAGKYFDTPVLEFPLMTDDVASCAVAVNSAVKPEKLLAEKFRVDQRKGKIRGSHNDKSPEKNPHKLLPPIEIDLHISELTDSTAGMSASDMLSMQLDAVRSTMKAHNRRIGQKIIFIHGKGEGVLRNEVLKLLRKEYPKAELQDASFAEYGFGATLVTIH